MSSSSNKGSRVKVKKKRDIRPNPTNSNESSSPPPSSMSSSAAVVKRVVRRRSKHHAGDADTSDDDDSDSNNSTDDDVTNNNNNDDTSNTNATVAECESVAAPLAVAALSLSAGSVLRKSPFRSEAIVGAMSASTGSVGATRSRSGSRSSPRDSFNRPTNISAKNLLGVEHAGFLRVFNGPPGQRMRFDDKTKSQFLMLRAADLYVYRSRDDDTPSEVIPLRASAVKVISGGDGMFAVPGTSADSPRSVSSAADEPSTPLSSSATLPSAPAPATAQLQRRDSPPRDNGNAPSILSSLKIVVFVVARLVDCHNRTH